MFRSTYTRGEPAPNMRERPMSHLNEPFVSAEVTTLVNNASQAPTNEICKDSSGFWKCANCDKRFVRKNRANSHLEKHRNKRKFVCKGRCGVENWY